ncbi:unnamed protein product [Trichobilharzia regenti]|nr:unnamed protein product [Trichobilharzia regenti]
MPGIFFSWFYRTIGYKPDRRRVACVTLIFAVFFILTRNLMILPFWYISFISYGSEAYKICIQSFPMMTTIFVTTCGLLDCLNIHWAFRTCRIGSKAIKTLSTADWQSDIRKAQARIHKRLRNLHRRVVVTKDEKVNNIITMKSSLTDNHFSETSLNSATLSSSGLSSSSYSTDSEHESVGSDVGEFQVPIVNDGQEAEEEVEGDVLKSTNENTSSHCTHDDNNNDTELIHRVDKQEVD